MRIAAVPVVFIVLLLEVGCAPILNSVVVATPTAAPTYTPLPTYTALPTYTPYPTPSVVPTPTATPLPTSTPTPTPMATPTPAPTPTPSAASAADKVMPAVVRIVTADGTGSGMVIDKAGYVLTNNHVVEKGQTATVVLGDGRQFPASVMGRDELRDLAVLRMNGILGQPEYTLGFPVVVLGKSSKLRIGEEVVGIGYPFGLGGSATVSKGIVSAFRNYDGVNYVQTDTAINPGNSGGPLITLDGEVIGINSLKYKGAEGMGLAIAIDSATPVVPALIAGASVLRPTPTTVPLKEYISTNPNYPYSIKYPANWSVDESKGYVIRLKDSVNSFGLDIELLPPGSGLVDSEFYGQQDQDKAKLNDNYKLISKSQKTYGNYVGWEFRYSFSQNGNKWVFQHFYPVTPGRVYGLRAWVAEEEGLLSQAVDIFASFRVTGPPPTSTPTPTPKPTPTPTPVPWKTYINSAYAYSIKYPGNWTLNDSRKEAVEIVAPEGWVVIRVSDPLWQTLRDHITWLVAYMSSNWDGFVLVSSRATDFQGREAWELVYFQSLTGTRYQTKELIVPTPAHKYEIKALRENGNVTTQMEQVLASFARIFPSS